jgi:hypothetical protein
MKTRESRYVKVARIAYHLTQEALPRYSHPKSPHHFTLPQLAACVLLMFYLDISYRDMEEWLLATDQVCKELELPRIPDHTTLQRTYQKLRKLDFDKMKNQLLDENNVEEETVASDSTGFSPVQASLYYQTRSGRVYRQWVKGAYAVGTETQFILAWQAGRGPSNDSAHLSALRRGSGRYGKHEGRRRAWAMLADAGFDGDSVEVNDLIPPIRRHGKLVEPARKARADLVSAARLDGLFGQRWKTETVNSVIKRKFGDTIRSRKTRLQDREPIIKGLVYNIHR